MEKRLRHTAMVAQVAEASGRVAAGHVGAARQDPRAAWPQATSVRPANLISSVDAGSVYPNVEMGPVFAGPAAMVQRPGADDPSG